MAFRRRTPPNAVPPAPASEEISDLRPACRAGAKPLKTPAATLTRNANSNRRESTADCRAFAAVSRGRNAIRALHGKRGEHTPERSAGKRDKEAVGKKLPADPPARSAQRESRADLAVASRSARQKETGDIQAGQTQQHCCRCEQHPERLRQPAPQTGMALWRRSEFER